MPESQYNRLRECRAVTTITGKTILKQESLTLGFYLFKWRSLTPLPFLIVCTIWGRFSLLTFTVGLSLILFGEVIRTWAAGHLGPLSRSTDTARAERLVTTGPYGHVRNPMYSANILIYLGFALLSNVFFPWFQVLTTVFFTAAYDQAARYEERFLRTAFREYASYSQDVPRWGWSWQRSGNGFSLGLGLRAELPTFIALLVSLALVTGGMLIW